MNIPEPRVLENNNALKNQSHQNLKDVQKSLFRKGPGLGQSFSINIRRGSFRSYEALGMFLREFSR